MTNKCPARSIESILKVITKRWNLQIMTDMFMGKTHFNEFKEGKDGLFNTTLSRNLKELEENGLIEKRVEKDNIEYLLTKEGELLNKVIYELLVYAIKKDVNNEYFTPQDKINSENNFKKYLKIN